MGVISNESSYLIVVFLKLPMKRRTVDRSLGVINIGHNQHCITILELRVRKSPRQTRITSD